MRLETYAKLSAREVSYGQAGRSIVPAKGRRELQAWRNGVMQNGLYVALSAQVALEQRLETIADNVANMNTVGYRATGVSFEKEMAKAGDARLSYVSSGSDFISRRLGGTYQDRQFA